MQKELTENWKKLFGCFSKPMTELSELNFNTLNNLMKNSASFDSLSQAKKPEDVFFAQSKLANAAYLEATKYGQKVLEIGVGAITEANKILSESFNQAVTRSADFGKTGSTHKNKE